MDEEKLKSIASQLARPSGEGAAEIGAAMNISNEFITARSIEALSPQQNETIAEIGPGNGTLSEPIFNTLGKNGKYFGIELSQDMAEEARQRLSNKASDIEIICGDCLNVDIPTNSVDGLLAVNVLYFIDDLDKFLSRVFSWIKPGGRVIFGIRSEKALKSLPFTQYGFNIRGLDLIKDRMKQIGFKGVESSYYDEGVVTLGELELPVDTIVVKGIV